MSKYRVFETAELWVDEDPNYPSMSITLIDGDGRKTIDRQWLKLNSDINDALAIVGKVGWQPVQPAVPYLNNNIKCVLIQREVLDDG